MRRQIELENEQHVVTVYRTADSQLLQIGNGDHEPVELKLDSLGDGTILLNGCEERVKMAIKGETAYIKAFNRTFTLKIIDPIEQASRASGGRTDSAKAPMPGVVVEIQISEGALVKQGQPLLTIESMKILSVIKSPRDGRVDRIHVQTGQTFDKNDELGSLIKEEEA